MVASQNGVASLLGLLLLLFFLFFISIVLFALFVFFLLGARAAFFEFATFLQRAEFFPAVGVLVVANNLGVCGNNLTFTDDDLSLCQH